MKQYSLQDRPHTITNLDMIKSAQPEIVSEFLIHFDHYDGKWHDFMDFAYPTYCDAIKAMVDWLSKDAVNRKEKE